MQTIDDNTAANYLKDLGALIRERAFEAREAKNRSNDPYDTGFLTAFHEVVSLMQSQAEAFGLPFEDIGLAGIDPEFHLL